MEKGNTLKENLPGLGQGRLPLGSDIYSET